jgi:hypothetical protein
MNSLLKGFEWGLGREAAHNLMRPRPQVRQRRYVQPKYNEWLTRTYESVGSWPTGKSAKAQFMQDFRVLASQGWGVFEFNGMRGQAMLVAKVKGKRIDVTYGRYTPPSLQR